MIGNHRPIQPHTLQADAEKTCPLCAAHYRGMQNQPHHFVIESVRERERESRIAPLRHGLGLHRSECGIGTRKTPTLTSTYHKGLYKSDRPFVIEIHGT